MQNLNGFIKVHRKLLEWEWYQDGVVKDVFLHLLLTANFKEHQWMGQTIGRGQVVTSYKHLAEELGFSVKQVRTALDKLKRTCEVASESTNRYTTLTVVNWDKYQAQEETAAGEGAGKTANEGQTAGIQTADKGQHFKKDKKDKNEKECQEKRGAYAQSRKQNRFINYTQSEYDFDELERMERELRDRQFEELERRERMETA